MSESVDMVCNDSSAEVGSSLQNSITLMCSENGTFIPYSSSDQGCIYNRFALTYKMIGTIVSQKISYFQLIAIKGNAMLYSWQVAQTLSFYCSKYN